MKKISAVLFSFLLVLGLAACGEVRESASPAAGSAESGMETADAETVSPEAAGTETGGDLFPPGRGNGFTIRNRGRSRQDG